MAPPRSPRRTRLVPSSRHHSWRRESWRLLAVPLLLLLALPIAALFLQASPAQVVASLGQKQVYQAVGLSLRTTLFSLALILLGGTPLAYWLAQEQFRGKQALDTLVDLPTLLPPSVAGLALLLTFGRRGLLGATFDAWGIQIAFTTLAVVLAQTFIAAPFYVRAAAVGFAAIDGELKQAAQLDGANRLQVLRHVTLPLSRQALLSGAIMSWARALGEFGATIIFAGNYPGRTQTMPTAIYLGLEVDLTTALALSVILVSIAFGSLLLLRGVLAHRP